MNKFKTTDNGGLPLVLDDFRWMHNSLAEGFSGLASFLGSNFIISGCSFSGIGTTTFNNTEGYVMLGGEVCYIAASVTPIDNDANPFLYLELSTTYDITGTKSFEDGTPHSTYEIRRGIINGYSTAQAGKVSALGLKTAKTLLNELILDVQHTFTKTQSWAESAASAVVAGQNIIPVADNTAGNSFQLNIDNYNTALQRFNSAYPNGTILSVLVVATGGVTGVVVSDGSALANGIVTPSAKSYSFKVGEVMQFVWSGGNAKLINGFRLYTPQLPITLETGAGWHASVTAKARLNGLGDMVVLTGQVGNNNYTTGATELAATLPAGTWPLTNLSFDVTERFNGGKGVVSILTTGEVRAFFDGMTSDPAGFTLDGIVYAV